jgi:hypothetical protein
MKASSSKYRKAETLWRDSVRKQSGGLCVLCWLVGHRRVEGVHCHHIVGRKVRRMAFWPLNGAFLCARHHAAEHDKAARLVSAIKARFPQWWAMVEDKKRECMRNTAPFTDEDLDHVIRCLNVNGAVSVSAKGEECPQ